MGNATATLILSKIAKRIPKREMTVSKKIYGL